MRLNIDLTQVNNQKNVFFTSDFHLFHHNVIRFDNRPFADVNEMHLAIEKAWNDVVKPEDIVIYLGDLSFAKREDKISVENLVNNLNGTIHYIIGNHDKYDDIKNYKKFVSVNDYLDLFVRFKKDLPNGLSIDEEVLFCCMHYPIYSWNKKHRGSYHVHGHCHLNLSEGEFHKQNRIVDVGCMGFNYAPISYLEIIKLKENIDFKASNNHH